MSKINVSPFPTQSLSSRLYGIPAWGLTECTNREQEDLETQPRPSVLVPTPLLRLLGPLSVPCLPTSCPLTHINPPYVDPLLRFIHILGHQYLSQSPALPLLASLSVA